VIVQAAALNPLSSSRLDAVSVGATLSGIGANVSKSSQSTPPTFEIRDVASAVTLLGFVSDEKAPITIVIDEFDQLTDVEQHKKFANLIKQLSDRGLATKLIVCGIAESAESLFTEHASIFRQVHACEVERLTVQARLDIIDDALQALQMTIPRGLCYRIATVSDGFPSFVHLITEKVLTSTFDAGLSDTRGDTYEQGLASAVTSVELTLKRTYERGVHRNTRRLEPLIWAVASDKFLDVNVETVWKHYSAIGEMLRLGTDGRDKTAQRLGLLCRPDYGPLLVRQRHANYTFREKMMRAYARLRAEYAGCQIGEENPDYSVGRTTRAPEMGGLIAYHTSR
jgi:uncharacterized protein